MLEDRQQGLALLSIEKRLLQENKSQETIFENVIAKNTEKSKRSDFLYKNLSIIVNYYYLY